MEDAVIIFKHFFDKLFSYLFGGLLPKKPRPYQSSLCVTAALLGWLMVQEQVLKKFNLCKSLEFVSTLYLLEDVIPLVYFQYQIFRTGNLALYMSVMAQMAILFNIGAEGIMTNQCFLSLVTLITKRTFFLTTGNANSTGFTYLLKKRSR